ncbi:TPA: hypothetical protein ACKLRZ_002179, partial [Neisseria gonorrhoeae]
TMSFSSAFSFNSSNLHGHHSGTSCAQMFPERTLSNLILLDLAICLSTGAPKNETAAYIINRIDVAMFPTKPFLVSSVLSATYCAADRPIDMNGSIAKKNITDKMKITDTYPVHLLCFPSTTAIKCFFLFCNIPIIDVAMNANANTAIQFAIKSANVNRLSIW